METTAPTDSAASRPALELSCPVDRRLAGYFRRPDPEFWRELFQPAPAATAVDQARRERLARYSLGMALVATLPYVFFSLALGPREYLSIVLTNVVAVAGYGLGLWAASLGAHRAARLWLLVTLDGHLAALAWLTGPEFGVGIFTLVAAGLAHVLHAPRERAARVLFTAVPLLLLLAGLVVFRTALVDFSGLPGWLLPFTRAGNTVFAAVTILLLLGVFDREVARLRDTTGLPLDVRIGLHTGPVIAGVIGSLRFSYDIWGDTVNTASRMESHGEPGRIQVTAETREALGEAFTLESRGVVDVKGKGPLPTWWLLDGPGR